MVKIYYVYIMTDELDSVLSVGFTNDLKGRVSKRKTGELNGQSKYSGLCKLVYFEAVEGVQEALQRKKYIRNCSEQKKEALIESMNPGWIDLFEG